MLPGAISSDIDTLHSIYKGRGCRRTGGYTAEEFDVGLGHFARFLESYRIPATLFMVGQDFERVEHHGIIRGMAAAGHEIANHSYSHPQGFRHLSREQQAGEIARMDALCEEVTGARPVGFRAPGWNAGGEVASILAERHYAYDSSVFPTSAMPILKFLHWRSTAGLPAPDRTTLGPLSHMLAPARPYRADVESLARRGTGVFEVPITVTPLLRWPVSATFLLGLPFAIFERSYRSLREAKRPMQLQFHLSDFVDYTTGSLADQLPRASDGVYIPQALRMPLAGKREIFMRAVELMAADYSFSPLRDWVRDA